MESTLVRMLLGLGIGLAAGILSAVVASAVRDDLPFWDAFLFTGSAAVLTGILAGILMRPPNLLLRLLPRIPDEFIFATVVILVSMGVVLAVCKVPDFTGTSRKVLGGSSTEDGSAPGRLSSGERQMVVVGCFALSVLSIFTGIARGKMRTTISGIKYSDREFSLIVRTGRARLAERLFAAHCVNKERISDLALQMGWSEENVRALIDEHHTSLLLK